ncbi:MAG: hypothetical protein NTX65_11215 [Ignavibacteriales bacterium]|nr:hypothetical protein [Ignavibacteriales bacterium]
MKVSTNSIGNYHPTYMKAAAANKSGAVQKFNGEIISQEEKKYFAQLYPTKQDEIMDYQLYNSKGKVSGVHVGSLFDRRG